MPESPTRPDTPRVVGVYDRPPWFRRRSVWLAGGIVVAGLVLSAVSWLVLLQQG